jgi:hypothetical protein
MLPPTSDRSGPLPSASEVGDEGSASSASGVPEGAYCAVHPERPAFWVCGRCGRFACTSCTTVLASGAAICAACQTDAPATIPWERRRELGLVRAAMLTVRDVLAAPARFFSQRPRERSIVPALALGMSFYLVYVVAGAVNDTASVEGWRASLRALRLPRETIAFLASPWGHVVWVAANVIAAPIAFLLAVHVLAALWWVGLRAVRGLRRPYAEIVRALCYAQAVWVVGPLAVLLSRLGPIGWGFALAFFGWVWVVQWVAVARTQGITYGRALAALAVWLPLALVACCLLWSGAYAWIHGIDSHTFPAYVPPALSAGTRASGAPRSAA